MISTAFNQIGRSKVTIATPAVESSKDCVEGITPGGALGSPSVTGRKSICVFCFASYTCILFIQPFQLEWGNSGSGALITHHAAQSVSSRVNSGWSWARRRRTQRWGETWWCLFMSVYWWQRKNPLLQLLSGFAECFQLHPGDSFCCLWIWQRWCWRGDFDPTHRVEGIVSKGNRGNVWRYLCYLQQTEWRHCLFLQPT